MIKRRLRKTLRALDNKSRKNRMLKLASFLPEKTAAGDQHGIFQNFQSNVTEYATRERHLSMRGNTDGSSRDKLYGVGPEHEDSYVPTEYVAPSLSTRYSPDRVGVQAQRVSDGVYKDPYTNKVYDYNEGFTAESGESYPGGSPALQSSLMHLANHLDGIGLIKEADYLDSVLRKSAVLLAMAPLPGIIVLWLLGEGDLSDGARVAWNRIPSNTRTALEAMASGMRSSISLLGQGVKEDLKAALRAVVNKALNAIDLEGLDRQQPAPQDQAEPDLRTSEASDDVSVLLKIAAGLDAKGDHNALKIVEDMISAIEV